MRIQVAVDARRFDRFQARVRPALESGIRAVTREVFVESQKRAPVRTGNLRFSGFREVDGLTGFVGYRAVYAPHVEFGTRPHLIFPRTRQVLRFEKGKEVIFARRVHHPGTREHPYLRPAIETASRGIEERFTRIIDRAIQEA